MRSRRILATTAAAAMSLSLLAATTNDDLVPVTETMYISAGCPQDTPGTCTSTRWLGKVSGDSTSNFITAITPVDEVTYRLDENDINWRDYASDTTFGSYLLDVSRDLGVTVTLTTEGVGANTTVHARLRATRVLADGTASNDTLTVDPQVVMAMTPTSTTPVEFAFDLPDDWDGSTLTRLTVEVAVHGAHAAAGYIDQEGGSPVTIPYLLDPDA